LCNSFSSLLGKKGKVKRARGKGRTPLYPPSRGGRAKEKLRIKNPKLITPYSLLLTCFSLSPHVPIP